MAVGCVSCGPATGQGSGRVHLAHHDSTGYQLIRNGKPFFVQGAAGISRLDLLAAYGGNTVRVYDPANLDRVLEEAEKYGLAVVADIPLPAYRRGALDAKTSLSGLTDSVLTIVARHRDHPALLFWMLGNEIFSQGYDSDYLQQYNALAAAVRNHDPDHPISTGVIPHQLLKLQLGLTRPEVDFLSLNIFGNVSTLERLKLFLTPVWRSPYLISEWGFNGPWEAEQTLWGAPLESPSSTKSRHLAERYPSVLSGAENGRLLGSLVFYWGQKFERTPTWFSLLSQAGQESEMSFTLGNLWRNTDRSFPGPRVDYLLLNGLGGQESIMLQPGVEASASVAFATSPTTGMVASWEIRSEDWYGLGEQGDGPESLPGLLQSTEISSAAFTTPRLPGPYRIYYLVADTAGYYATANIPFYVLSADDAQ